MKFKLYFIASLILAILMVSAVSANDTVSQDIISDNDDNSLEITQNEINTETETAKTFMDLYKDISNATGVAIHLTPITNPGYSRLWQTT